MVTRRSKNELVEIRPIETKEVLVTIVGDTPLICHAWSTKAKRMMLNTQQGKTKGKKKDPKNPFADFVDSLYWLGEKPSTDGGEDEVRKAFESAVENGARFGFPANAIKDATVSAAFRNGWTKDKVSARGAFFIKGENGNTEFVEVLTDEAPVMREDMVKVGMGSADLRYRGEFRHWKMVLTISYNVNGGYNLENIVNMLNAGGYSCGIGEWRPEKDGTNGMYHVGSYEEEK